MCIYCIFEPHQDFDIFILIKSRRLLPKNRQQAGSLDSIFDIYKLVINMAVGRRKKTKMTTLKRACRLLETSPVVLQESSLNQIIKLARRKKTFTQDSSSGSKKVPAQKNTDATTVLIRYSLTLCNL
jgi:SpoU rRNA methylase family enzyme